jgi:hypothetical protein
VFGYQPAEKAGLATVVVLGSLLLALRFSEFPLGAGMDDAYYVELARSLAAGRGPVVHLNPVVDSWRPGIFPVGFPLLLSPVAWLAGSSLQLFKLLGLLAWIALVPVCLRLARTEVPVLRVALTALVCLNPWSLAYAVRVFSDLPFVVASLTAVMLFLDLADLPRIRPERFAALIVVTAAAVLIRSVGLALPLAMVLFWLSHRRYLRTLLLCAGTAAVLLPHALMAGGGLITASSLQQVFGPPGAGVSRVTLVLNNFSGYLRELPVVLVPGFGTPAAELAAGHGLGTLYGGLQLLVGVLLVLGILRGLILAGQGHPARTRFLFIYLAIYGGVLLNFYGYPTGVQGRLLLPVMPLLYLMLLIGLQRRRRTRGLLAPAVILLLALSLGHNGYRAVRTLGPDRSADDPAILDPRPGAAWVRGHTEPDDLIMVRWPLRQHIHVGRPVVGFGTVGARELDLRVATYGVDYVLLGPGTDGGVTARLASLLEEKPERYPLVHRDVAGDVAVFKVEKVP